MTTTDSGSDTDGGSGRSIRDGSLLFGGWRKLGEFASNSRLAATFRGIGRAVRGSYVYSWLTAEPDPEVVVIDLRETHTVGPFVRLLDGLVSRLAPYWRESGINRAIRRLSGVGSVVASSRTGRILGAMLAPPEPPVSGADDGEAERNDRNAGANAAGDDGDTDADGAN